MTITNYPLPEAAFTELAEGGGSPATMRRLGDAQRSKHLMLLHAIAEAAPMLAAGRDASFQNKTHLAMEAAGFGEKSSA